MMSSIEVMELSKSFRGVRSERRVLDQVSLSVNAGKIVALVGESGSGKSTLARVVLGLERPSSGRVFMRVGSAEERISIQQVQMVFQDPFASLNPAHRVRTHLERPLRKLRGLTAPDAKEGELQRLLESVGLSPAEHFLERFPGSLSGGQRQRVALARALAAAPAFLIADEPTSMLDISLRGAILELFRGLREAGIGVLLITHDLQSVRALSDEVYVLHRGRIVERGKTQSVLSDPQHPYTRCLLGAVPDPFGEFLSRTGSAADF